MPPPRVEKSHRARTPISFARGAALGAAAGALAGSLLTELGLAEIIGTSGHVVFYLAGFVGAVIGAFGWYWLPLAADALLILAYVVIADTPIMYRVAAGWVRSDPIPATADAIVVLSASINSDGMLSTQGVQRLLTGIGLYQRGVAPKLFTTAVEQTFGDRVRSSTADQQRLIEIGGAQGGWTSLTGVFTTRDEALQSAAQLPAGTGTVVVVTSPLHTRRACATFEAVGFKVVCVASREHDHVTWHPISAADRLAAFRDYAYERLGMVKYRSKGWVPAG